MGKYKNIEIGDIYGRWTVIKKGTIKRSSNQAHRKYWLCECSCDKHTIKEVRDDGLINGTSSGCRSCANLIDLTNKKFGYLTVLNRNNELCTDYNHTFYDVKCDCGKIYSVRTDALTSGSTLSCGCKQQEHIDLIGQKFGKLTVLKHMYRYSYKNVKTYSTSVNFWECQCECGTIVVKRQHDLIRIHGCSCGCDIRSTGEVEMAKLLTLWNYKYIEQYRYKDCKWKNPLPFDFVLLDCNDKIYCAIEYDGEFHYEAVRYSDITQEQAEENLKTTIIRDSIKTQYCKINNIPLIRIPYWEKDNLDYYLFDKLAKCGVLEETKRA